jgi:hypothetical protein
MRLAGRPAYSLSKRQKLHKKEAPCMMKVQLFFSQALKLNAFFIGASRATLIIILTKGKTRALSEVR